MAKYIFYPHKNTFYIIISHNLCMLFKTAFRTRQSYLSLEKKVHFCFQRETHLCFYVFSCFCCVQLFVTPWMVARQAPLSMGFSRQEYWSELPCPPPRDLPNPETEPVSPALQMDSLHLSNWGSPKHTYIKTKSFPYYSEFC